MAKKPYPMCSSCEHNAIKFEEMPCKYCWNPAGDMYVPNKIKNKEKLEAAFDKFQGEFRTFNKVHPENKIRLEALIFNKLGQLVPSSSASDTHFIATSNDYEIILSIDIHALAKVATEADILYLVRCGLTYNKHTETISI